MCTQCSVISVTSWDLKNEVALLYNICEQTTNNHIYV